MSGGPICACPEAKKPVLEREWRVYARHCNHSAFNGYHETYSRYSGVECLKCGKHWRTNGAYVNHLKDHGS